MDSICIDCRKSADCKHKPRPDQWTVASCSSFEAYTIVTNADRIRSMTDEELAEYLIADIEAEAIRRAGRHLTSGEINRAIADCLSWLKSPVEVDE